MQNWLSDAIINTDRNLKLQYLAGLGLNLYQSDAIYRAMIRDVQYPEELFEGSEATLKALRNKIDLSIGGTPSF
jgi:spermidine synthase